MGWCHEFGPQIHEGCDEPMTAQGRECGCAACGAVCAGRYGGCQAVWERNRPVRLRRRRPEPAPEPALVGAAPAAAEAVAENAGGDLAALVEQAVDARLQPVLDELRGLTIGLEAGASAALPDRLAASIAAVLGPVFAGSRGQTLEAAAREAPSVDMRRALADAQAAAADLKAELVRLRAFRLALTHDNPALAAAIDQAADRGESRLARAAAEVEGLRAFVEDALGPPGGDLFDDLDGLVPDGVVGTGMVEDQVREPEGFVAAREVDERVDAAKWPFDGVADQVDPLDR